MAIEQLSILIDVIDNFSHEIDKLLFQLGQLEMAAEAVDNITIDVDVRGDEQAMAQLATIMGAAEAADDDFGFSMDAEQMGLEGAFPSADELDFDTIQTGTARIDAGHATVHGTNVNVHGLDLDNLDPPGADDIGDITTTNANVDAGHATVHGKTISIPNFKASDLDMPSLDDDDADLFDLSSVNIAADSVDIQAVRATTRGLSAGGGGMGDVDLDKLAEALGLSDADLEADIEMDDVARSLGGVGDGADEAAEGLSSLTDIKMEDWHNALAKLLPLLLVIIGALPALIGGLVVLASAAVAAAGALAALTAFAGLGAALEMGEGDLMAGLQEIMDQVQEDFMDAFRPVAERLAPLFRDALDGLDMLFQEIANQQDVFLDMRSVARDFGDFILDTLPPVLAELSAFAEAMAPAISALASIFGELNVLRGFAGFFADALPSLMDFTRMVLELLPAITQLSVGFLQVTTMIFKFLMLIGDIIGMLPISNELFGYMIGTMLTLWTVMMLLNKQMFIMAGKSLVNLGAAVLGTTINMEGLTLSSLSAATAINILRAAIVGLLALTGVGLVVGALSMVASSAMSVKDNVDAATDSLKEFQRTGRGMSGMNPYREPDIGRSDIGSPRGAGSNVVNVTVEGSANEDDVRTQTNNAMYRMKRGDGGSK